MWSLRAGKRHARQLLAGAAQAGQALCCGTASGLQAALAHSRAARCRAHLRTAPRRCEAARARRRWRRWPRHSRAPGSTRPSRRGAPAACLGHSRSAPGQAPDGEESGRVLRSWCGKWCAGVRNRKGAHLLDGRQVHRLRHRQLGTAEWCSACAALQGGVTGVRRGCPGRLAGSCCVRPPAGRLATCLGSGQQRHGAAHPGRLRAARQATGRGAGAIRHRPAGPSLRLSPVGAQHLLGSCWLCAQPRRQLGAEGTQEGGNGRASRAGARVFSNRQKAGSSHTGAGCPLTL